jgi:hypothetical protein
VGTYADSLLSEGETVIRRERQHWLALLLDSRAAIGVWLVALLVLIVLWFLVPSLQGTGRTILNYLFTGAVIIGAVIFAVRWWQWRTEEYLVTSRRLLKVSGIINKESGDSSLEKINDAVLFENLLGRILNYGDLDILTAAEVAVDRYRMLHHAKAFKIDMLNAKHTLEHEVAYVEMPSPPIRTDGSPSAPAAPAVPPVAAAVMDTPIVASTATPVAAAAAPAAAAMVEQAPPVVAEPPAPEVAATPAVDAPLAPQAAPVATMETPAAPPVAASAAATDAIDTPDEVMQALSRLADLRDNGTITPEEYESKKQELLGRL